MGYMIEYGGQVPMAQKKRRRNLHRWIVAACLLAVAVAVRYFWGDMLLSILIPGEDEATVEAFSNLMSGLGEGETFSECVTAFCREVIYGAP